MVQHYYSAVHNIESTYKTLGLFILSQIGNLYSCCDEKDQLLIRGYFHGFWLSNSVWVQKVVGTNTDIQNHVF